ncbi:MAG: threonine/serine exporter family protein [Bacteroidales bacterium]|nr:threonine/serine exporter family protein [Bacteroidales bacterium]
MEQQHDFSEVLEVASIAGHILLENGAEISRVEDIMARISTYFGVDKGNFFVLSNGIFTTGSAGKVEKAGGQASTYANVEFIPIRPIQLQKVVEVNQLSYDISAGKCSLQEARARLEKIRNTPAKPMWEQTLGSAFGAAGFCAVFGGGWMDCGAAFVVGCLLNLFIFLVSGRYMSRIVGGICNALAATLLCVGCHRLGFGNSLANVIIGAIMPLIPGVPFVNGVRDLANADYLAGLTRLTDALLGFFCIAIGVSVGFMLDGALFKGIIELNGVWVNPETAGLLVQTVAAFIGTTAFAVLFGVPRKQYIAAGVVGALGWLLYLVLFRNAGLTPAIATVISTVFIGVLSRVFAVVEKCPAAVFLLCGIFPLVPGAGIFWCTYYLISSHLELSSTAGFTAAKIAIAIVLGIILAMELPQRIFSGRRRLSH